MKNDARHHRGQLFGLWMLAAAAIFPARSDALVLGEIQVNSHLGQPLNAQIAFVDIADLDVAQLKIRLAGVDEYRKLGLQYPEGAKFVFKVVNEPGALAPFLRVYTQRPIDEPYLNLLLEIREPAGTLTRAYTFLLDPPQEGYSGVDQALVPESAAKTDATGVVQTKAAQVVKSAAKRTAKPKRSGAAKLDRISHMKLAMSLSISHYDPSSQSGDALQEELIAKEKSLADMKSQIGEMQQVIRSLESKLGQSELATASGVAAGSGVEAGSAVPADAASAPQAVAESEPDAAVPVQAPVQTAAPAASWLNPLLAVIVLLMGGAAFFGYRKYRQMHAWHHGAFDEPDASPSDEMDEEQETGGQVMDEPVLKEPALKAPGKPQAEQFSLAAGETAPQAGASLNFGESGSAFGERSIETPAYVEQPSEPTVPPEYTILLEANRYMRSGKEQQAEEALLRAIDVNPKNPYGYQALLKIYSARNDRVNFERIATRLRETGDQAAFEEAAETGRKLDPENPLYA